jgi:type IV secretory pathway VirJ component
MTIFTLAIIAIAFATLLNVFIANNQDITTRKITHDFINVVRHNNERLKEYALAYNLDNSYEIDIEELYRQGRELEFSIGQDSFDMIVRRTIQQKELEGSTSSSAWKKTAYKASTCVVAKTISLVSHIIASSSLIGDKVFSMLKTVQGGDRSEEPNFI